MVIPARIYVDSFNYFVDTELRYILEPNNLVTSDDDPKLFSDIPRFTSVC
jgi:hypothetical protein